MKVAVVGSGVVGLTIGFQLARHGFSVTLFDSGQPGRESSWAGAGILPPAESCESKHASDHLRRRSNQLHAELSQELLEFTGIDNEFRRCGGIYLASTPGEAASLMGISHLWQKQGITCEPLDRSSLMELEPELASWCGANFRQAFFCPEECQIRNPRHLKALEAGCRKLGVSFEFGNPVEKIHPLPGRVQLLARGNRHEFDSACVACGAWSSSLLGNLSSCQVVPVKGHMLLYKFPRPLFQRIINEGNRYLVPRMDGHLLVGSSEEESGFDKSKSNAELSRLLKFATDISKELCEQRVIDSWTGLRPMSYDGLPYVGQHSEHENLFVATGHFRAGLQLSTGTADIICRMMLKQPVDFDTFAIRPER